MPSVRDSSMKRVRVWLNTPDLCQCRLQEGAVETVVLLLQDDNETVVHLSYSTTTAPDACSGSNAKDGGQVDLTRPDLVIVQLQKFASPAPCVHFSVVV